MSRVEAGLASSGGAHEYRITPDDCGTDAQEIRHVARRSAEALRAVRPEDYGGSRSEGYETAIRANAAEIAAVVKGRKTLFHEHVGDLAEPFARRLRRVLPIEVSVRAETGHLYVWRKDHLKMSIGEIHRLSLANENGELLGYGRGHLNAPGTVLVIVSDKNGDFLGGFHARPEEAERYGRERARDYADAMGEPVTLRIIERRPS